MELDYKAKKELFDQLKYKTKEELLEQLGFKTKEELICLIELLSSEVDLFEPVDEPLGILEMELIIRNEGVNRNLSLHYLFSYYDEQLYCRCLDFNVYSHIDLRDEVKLINQSDENPVANLAKKIVSKVCIDLGMNIVDTLFMRQKNGDRIYTWHSREQYWAEYRKIREEMSNSYLNEYFYPNEKNTFIGLNEAIEEKLEDIEREMEAIINNNGIKGTAENAAAFFIENFATILFNYVNGRHR